jgi:hypothetical protein
MIKHSAFSFSDRWMACDINSAVDGFMVASTVIDTTFWAEMVNGNKKMKKKYGKECFIMKPCTVIY